jgi:hypothetical protein
MIKKSGFYGIWNRLSVNQRNRKQQYEINETPFYIHRLSNKELQNHMQACYQQTLKRELSKKEQ